MFLRDDCRYLVNFLGGTFGFGCHASFLLRLKCSAQFVVR
jgi:hypothetical protein